MKTLLTTTLLITTCLIHTFGQNSKYDFARGVFKTEYKKQRFEKFGGRVEQVNKNTFRFGDKVVVANAEDVRLMTIFANGIFYPDIIDNRPATKPLTKAQKDKLTESEQLFYNLSRNDSTRIGSLEELERLNPDARTKRFVFWLYQKGMINPTECYIELYNDKGTKSMAMEEFIKNSRLTFYYRGTIIL